jgi:hypothetical protein
MTTRRKWDAETIHSTLEPIVAELGRFPKREELSARGLSGLSTAMGKLGGVAEWRARFADGAAAAAPAAEATPAPEVPAAVETVEAVEVIEVVEVVEIPYEVIAERAYYIALEQQGGDPIDHWLTAERELAGAAA